MYASASRAAAELSGVVAAIAIRQKGAGAQSEMAISPTETISAPETLRESDATLLVGGTLPPPPPPLVLVVVVERSAEEAYVSLTSSCTGAQTRRGHSRSIGLESSRAPPYRTSTAGATPPRSETASPSWPPPPSSRREDSLSAP